MSAPSAASGADRPLAVLLAGGGSAGHVSPLLALADCLRRRDPATGVLVLGTAEGLESRLVPARGYQLALVPRVPLPRRPSPALLHLPGRLLGAVRAAERAILAAGRSVGAARADVVVGVGGYVSVPAYLAARRLGVPVVVHEANHRPGVANRLGARLTPHVATTFPGTRLEGRGGSSTLTGLPMRTEVTGLDRAAQRAAGRAAFGLDPGAPTLLVFGGSLGAQRLNTALAAGAARLLAPLPGGGAPQVLHLTGAGKGVTPEGLPPGAVYRAVEFTDRMDLAYAAADLALCRAGAGTVCETTAVGLPAVYVPLPVGNGEQRDNAAGAVAAGAALLVEDADVTPDWVAGPLRDLLTGGGDGAGRLTAMSVAATGSSLVTGARDGDERLADLVEVAAGRRRAADRDPRVAA